MAGCRIEIEDLGPEGVKVRAVFDPPIPPSGDTESIAQKVGMGIFAMFANQDDSGEPEWEMEEDLGFEPPREWQPGD